MGCRIVVSQITSLAASVGIRIAATASVHTDWRKHDGLLDLMRSADLVIVNGEGTLHDSTHSAHALAEVGPFCQGAGVPSVLMNTVYQRNDSKIASDCQAFDRIYARESRSAKAMRDVGLRAEVVPDLTLSSEAMSELIKLPKSSTIITTDNANGDSFSRIKRVAVARSDVSFLHLDGSEPANPFADNSSLPECVYTDAGRLDRAGPPELRKNPLFRPLRKSLFKPKMLGHMRMERELRKPQSTSEILAKIASSRGVVAGRFHAMCMAMLAARPFAAMSSNTYKVEGLLEDADLAHLITNDPHEAYRKVEEWNDEDSFSIAAYVQKAKDKAKAMFAEVSSLSIAPTVAGPILYLQDCFGFDFLLG
nr:polysaccharide pyruvyl transferase family protein [Mesorhizobium soli]